MRTPYDMFNEYHTSADNLGFMKKDCLANSFLKYLLIIHKLEQKYYNFKERKKNLENKKPSKNDPVFINLFPKCEPQLGKRGISAHIGGIKEQDSLKQKKAILWILNFCTTVFFQY